MADNCLTIGQAVDFAARDNLRLLGEIAPFVARKAVYNDVFEDGTMPSNYGKTIRVAVGEKAALAQNTVNPTFTNSDLNCQPAPNTDRYGSREYQIVMQTLPGRSDWICIKQARTAFLSSYKQATRGLKHGIVQLVDADNRWQSLVLGGTKLVINSTQTFDNCLAGGVGAINTNWNNITPDSHVTFRAVKRAAVEMHDSFDVEPFVMNTSGGTEAEMFTLILGQNALDYVLAVEDVLLDNRAMVTGRYTIGEKAINGFTFQGPYRNIGFAVDPRPLRATAFVSGESVNGSGVITNGTGASNRNLISLVPGFAGIAFIDPYVNIAVSNGFAQRPNPYWLTAEFEFALLAGSSGMKRLTPAKYVGEDMVQFPGQLVPETLEFVNIRDNNCNLYGHNGLFLYEIERAFQPEQPQAFCGIMFKRCSIDLGLVAC